MPNLWRKSLVIMKEKMNLIEPGIDNKEREDDTLGNTDKPKEEERSIFRGDQRRVHHHGESDRRGIVNKRTKVFTRKEYVDMLREHLDVG